MVANRDFDEKSRQKMHLLAKKFFVFSENLSKKIKKSRAEFFSTLPKKVSGLSENYQKMK